MLESFFERFAQYTSRRSLPRYDGRIQIEGLGGPVKITFDDARIPHIVATCAEDLFFGQGYVHAMERMWQLEFMRRVSEGRLAETFGNLPVNWKDLSVRLRDTRLVELDQFLRSLRIIWSSERTVKAVDYHTRSMLDAYCEGVNTWVMNRPHRRLPVEFRLLGLEAEPWTPVVAVSMGKAMAYHLNFSWKTILIQYGIADKLPPHLAEDLLPESYPSDRATIVSGLADLLNFDTAARESLGYRGTGLGSDSWALHGSRTVSGHPLLVNDPHLRMRAPCIWYLCHLRGGEYDVQGVSLPGMPGVVIGRNRSISWGVTNAMLHDADFYIEKLDPAQPDTVEVNGEWVPLETIPLEIKVRQSPSEFRTLRVSRHGPLLSDVLPGFRHDATQALALKWVAHEVTTEMEGVLALNRARNRDELSRALSKFHCPGQNFVFADAEGNIGYRLAARIPIRKQGNGQRPVPGWNDDYDWVGFVPFEENPRADNPPEGFVATANNQITDESYPYFLGHLWEPHYRITRIRELLTAREKHDVASMQAMQSDVVSVQAREFLKGVVEPFAESPEVSRLSPAAKELLAWLRAWDGNCTVDSGAASAFHVLQYQLLLQVFGKRLGEETLLAYLEHFNESVLKLEKILARPDSEWFRPTGKNGCIALALENSVRWLERELGPDRMRWAWGNLHKTVAEHPMGMFSFTAAFFNLGPCPMPGSIGTLNAGQFFFAYPFRHYVGSSYREIIDMSPKDDSWYVQHTGQSGNPASPHYRDQFGLWLAGKYLKMSWSAQGPMMELHPPEDQSDPEIDEPAETSQATWMFGHETDHGDDWMDDEV
ncbi:MAG TPA: penicillin acylase family protein [Candidatus Xenobia bacterium]